MTDEGIARDNQTTVLNALKLINAPSAIAQDTDSDGLVDDWERYYFGNLNFNGGGDNDGDSIANLHEQQGGTDPVADLGLEVFTPLEAEQ